ncbi:MAG: hypothetical protein E7147_04540 [Rikenellaceae bacterium]|nr:hypothetical protein [Rikenellaceae bacterium]
MKKIVLSLVALLCVASVSAQSKFESSVKSAAKAVASQKWSVGLRVGSGLQADAECFYSDKAYVEARFGMQYVAGLAADFTVLHNWNCCTMDWTPSAGQWFFDAGVGVNVGGAAHVAYVGVAGQAKLGIKFSSAPVRLSLDWTPSFGPIIGYAGGYSHAAFFEYGLCNLGISAVYCF